MMRRRRTDAAPAIEQVGVITERLAVLLAAGVPPAASWRYLVPEPRADTGEAPDHHKNAATDGREHQAAHGREPPPSPPRRRSNRAAHPHPYRGIVEAVTEAADDGDSIAGAIARASGRTSAEVRPAWRGLAAAWYVATESGAPLAPCLRDLASAFRSIGQTQRDLQVALAGPAATARLVMALPVIGVLFGMGLGFDTLHTLFATVPGLACLAVGTTLMIAGAGWNRRMIRGATPTDVTPGLIVDLMAIAMAGGGSVDRARAVVAQARSRYAIVDGRENVVDDVIALSHRAGVPAGELLRSEAEQARRQARSDGQRSAASLAVRLMMPLGVCILPAFMVLGVAPLLLSIISSTVAAI